MDHKDEYFELKISQDELSEKRYQLSSGFETLSKTLKTLETDVSRCVWIG